MTDVGCILILLKRCFAAVHVTVLLVIAKQFSFAVCTDGAARRWVWHLSKVLVNILHKYKPRPFSRSLSLFPVAYFSRWPTTFPETSIIMPFPREQVGAYFCVGTPPHA